MSENAKQDLNNWSEYRKLQTKLGYKTSFAVAGAGNPFARAFEGEFRAMAQFNGLPKRFPAPVINPSWMDLWTIADFITSDAKAKSAVLVGCENEDGTLRLDLKTV